MTGRFQRATRSDAPMVASIAFGRLVTVTVLVFIALTSIAVGVAELNARRPRPNTDMCHAAAAGDGQPLVDQPCWWGEGRPPSHLR